VNAVVELSRVTIDAVVMDLDGVITDTASVHEMAWKRLFDGFLATRPRPDGQDHAPFENEDYRRYVDGRPRFDGALGFLTSRGIKLSSEEVNSLAEQKDRDFQDVLEHEGVRLIPGALSFLNALRLAGFRTAVVSASRNANAVLNRAGLADFFDARVDGVVAAELGLPGKPDPAVYLEAAEMLRTPPQRSVVVEDALAGVEAGRRGGFGLVVGVDRAGHGQELLDHGADVIVADLTGLVVAPMPGGEPSGGVPSAGEPSASERSGGEPSASEPAASEPIASEPASEPQGSNGASRER
jgi:beta-phosphoglucomutase family hydrolase